MNHSQSPKIYIASLALSTTLLVPSLYAAGQTSLSGTFFKDEAATGGSDFSTHDSSGVVSLGIHSLAGLDSQTGIIKITGIAFAAPAPDDANDATSINFTINYLGADGVSGGDDDVNVVSSQTLTYAHTGAGVYDFNYHSGQSTELDGKNNKFEVFVSINDLDPDIQESVRFKVDNENLVKLSIAGSYYGKDFTSRVIGRNLKNGGINVDGNNASYTYDTVEDWHNIGTGDAFSNLARLDESLDGSYNALLAEDNTRLAAVDTGHTLKQADTFDLNFWWKDSYNWADESDRIFVRFFVTDSNSIDGTATDLTELLVPVSSQNDTYEYHTKQAAYSVLPEYAGKKLFIAFDTLDGNYAENGFCRIDNIELLVHNGLKLQLSLGEQNAPNLKWRSIAGNRYLVEYSNNLSNWLPVDGGSIFAMGEEQTLEVVEANSNQQFYRISEGVRPSFVDSATPRSAQPILNIPTSDNWELDFSDEFNSFDDTKWYKSVSTKTRSPRLDKGVSAWFWVSENVDVVDGVLALKATKPTDTSMNCGSVETRGLYEQAYGYMEARIQIAPTEHAIHTAFWLQGENMGNIDGSGADGAEIDIFESAYTDDHTQTVFHYDGYNSATKKAVTKHWDAPGLHSGFRVFGMHWTANKIDIYYDGVKKWSYSGVAVPQVKEWLWLSVGASFGDGDFQNGVYPQYSYVDYVRVWQSVAP